MEKIFFTNAKGQKSPAVWCGIAGENALQDLERGKLSSAAQQAIAVIRLQPSVAVADLHYSTWGVFRSNKEKNVYAVVGHGSWSNVLDHNRLSIDESQWDMGQPQEHVFAAAKILSRLSSYIDNPKNSRALLNTPDAFTRHHFSPVHDFAVSTSFAFYCCTKNGQEGYLDKNGSLGPLSKAQTYDNEMEMHAAMSRQSTFRYYDQLQIVNLSMAVTGLGDLVSCPRNLNGQVANFTNAAIYDVGAYVQKRAIEDALKQASFEQIEQAYKSLTQTTQSTKRKM